MKFEEFRATGRDVANLGVETGDLLSMGKKGRLYEDFLFIERADPVWILRVDRSKYESADLELLERELYNWACKNGYFGMTYEDFKATGRDVLNISEHVLSGPRCPGRMYLNNAGYIEKDMDKGLWRVKLEGDVVESSILEPVERVLYKWFKGEGLIP